MSGQYQEAHKDGNRLHDKIQEVLAMMSAAGFYVYCYDNYTCNACNLLYDYVI